MTNLAEKNLETAPTSVSADVQREIEKFLYLEARLLDENNYSAWMELLAPDIHYWMPVIENRKRDDPAGVYGADRLAYFDDTLDQIERRVQRYESKTAWMEDPATRHVHVITNIEVELGEKPNEVIAHSVFTNYRNRGERDEDLLFGRRHDVIRKENGRWLLARRKILIAQNLFLSKNINTFF